MAPSPIPLLTRCGHCKTTKSLLRCSRCKVQHYCSPEHQAADHPSHKIACSNISKTFKCMKAEEERLRQHPGNSMTPPDPFTNSVGHFWGVFETQDYMQLRFFHIERLARIKTHDSVIAQLDHAMDCLRLCRSDSIGVRDLVPSLMIRLDKDQEAYDFIKWGQTTAQDLGYDYNNLSLGFLDIRDADCFEDVSYLCGEVPGLSATVGVLLLKIKMIHDLTALEESVNGKIVPANIPSEILNSIRDYAVRSPVIRVNQEIMKSKDQKDKIKTLSKQIKMLYSTIDRRNKHFWPKFFDREGGRLEARPEYYTVGGASEVQYMVNFLYDAWVETDGAIELVRLMKNT